MGRKLGKLPAGLYLSALSACGGGSAPTSLSFAEMQDLVTEIDDLTENYERTPNASIPSSGTASYEGYAILFDVINADLSYAAVGVAQIEVDFAHSIASGSASNFFEIDVDDFDSGENEFEMGRGEAICGSMTYNGTDDTVTGSLTKLSGKTATYDMNVESAAFYGPNTEELYSRSVGTSQAAGRSDSLARLVIDTVKKD